jgi:RNA polymerase subunit RPABC4/transcription elongation factor Spt4
LTCPHCHTVIADDSEYCPSCGALLVAEGSVSCEKHGSRPAVAACIICALPLCKDCVQNVGDRSFCDEHRNIEVEQDWALVYASTDVNDAELAKSVLEEAGFNVVTRDFLPIGYIWDGAGDSSMSRSMLRKPAKVFVPVQDYLSASETLDEWSGGAD